MNKNAKKWVVALRSDEFEQGRGKLCRVRGGKKLYCCLGVACELYLQEHDDLERRDDGTYLDTEGIFHVSYLPKVVREWLGLGDSYGGWSQAYDPIPGAALSARNDAGASFLDIADIIEQEPKGLFKD